MAKSRTSTRLKIGEIVNVLDRHAPYATAEDWDNVGLLIPPADDKISGVLVSVDLTELAIERAKKQGLNLIVTHHPPIFPKKSGIAKIARGSLIEKCMRAGIGVLTTHTNFDQGALEVGDKIIQALSLTPVGRLVDSSASFYKLVVYVPMTHLEAVRLGLGDAGAGVIGAYDHCSFYSEGEGNFRGRVGSVPYLGKPGKFERVREARLETIVPDGLVSKVISSLKKIHPYEEVAYDLFKLENRVDSVGLSSGLGYGIVGEFKKHQSFDQVLGKIYKLFGVKGGLLTQGSVKTIKRLGFVAGKGSSFTASAISLNCDLFITGETGYHLALGSVRQKMAVLELGHVESECFFPETVAAWLNRLGVKTMLHNERQQNYREKA